MPVEPNRPFRWDLVRPDQLGTLLDGTSEPDLWFLQDLVVCAAKVLARCADGEVYFVGRSVDSVYDLLSGALTETTWRKRLHQLPLSLGGLGGWFGDLDHAETAQLRTNLTASGLAPSQLAQGRGPVVFVDIVDTGATFENLYRQLRGWATDERAAWDVIRRKLHFLGITRRRHTSPNTWRWQQHADWIADLPARAVRNISLDSGAFSYFADRQVKLTPRSPAGTGRTRRSVPRTTRPPLARHWPKPSVSSRPVAAKPPGTGSFSTSSSNRPSTNRGCGRWSTNCADNWTTTDERGNRTTSTAAASERPDVGLPRGLPMA
jgi:hypothetical protein